MIRVLLTVVLPLVAPFLAYAFYVWMQRKRALASGRPEPGWRDTPWIWLALAGLLLLTAALVTVRLTTGNDPGEMVPRLSDEERGPSPKPVQ